MLTSVEGEITHQDSFSSNTLYIISAKTAELGWLKIWGFLKWDLDLKIFHTHLTPHFALLIWLELIFCVYTCLKEHQILTSLSLKCTLTRPVFRALCICNKDSKFVYATLLSKYYTLIFPLLFLTKQDKVNETFVNEKSLKWWEACHCGSHYDDYICYWTAALAPKTDLCSNFESERELKQIQL